MDWILDWAGIIMAPLAVVVALYVNDRRAKKSSEQSATVAGKTLEISEDEMETTRFQALTEGFNLSFNQLRTDLSRQTEKTDEAVHELGRQKTLTQAVTDELVLQKAETRRIADTVSGLIEDRGRLIEHLNAVERLIPDPPGPPPRPKFLTHFDFGTSH